MGLSERERLQLKRRLLDTLAGRDGATAWALTDTNMLLAEFGLPPIGEIGPWDDVAERLGERFTGLSDTTLTRMGAAVFDLPESDVARAAVHDPTGLWTDGMVRLFITHSAIHKGFAHKVAERLGTAGVHGFVAHDSVEVTAEWQTVIERALNTCDALAALVHPEANGSVWCQQEIGWAMGRGIPHFLIRIPTVPTGFPARTQWSMCEPDAPDVAAEHILKWVNGLPGFGDRLTSGLFEALRRARSYEGARDVAVRIAQVAPLTSAQMDVLDEIVAGNDQVGGSIIARRALEPVYAHHDRPIPKVVR